MIYVCHVLLNKFAIDITCLSSYFITVSDLSVKVISLPIYDNIGILKIYMIYIFYEEFFNGISSVNLSDNLSHFELFNTGKYRNY